MTILSLLLVVGYAVTCLAHSTMTCVNKVGATCAIDIRKNPFYTDQAPRCCGSKLATEAVKCPAPEASKGTVSPGSIINIEWPARNHAVGNQAPDGGITEGVAIYLAPATATTLGDYCGSTTIDKNCPNKICTGSFGPSTCGGTNGNDVPCTIPCTIPTSQAAGKYNLLWLWDWSHNDGSMYSTCADITIGGSVMPAPAPATNSPTPLPSTGAPTVTPPTPPGATKSPTRAPSIPAVSQDDATCSPRFNDMGADEIRFVNLGRDIPWAPGSLFLQEIQYKKSSLNLGVLVVDIIGINAVGESWFGKGFEIIPGAAEGTATVPLKVYETRGAEQLAGGLRADYGPFKLKAYFVDKSIYDANEKSGLYWDTAQARATQVESDPICAGCSYYRHCGLTADPKAATAGGCNPKQVLEALCAAPVVQVDPSSAPARYSFTASFFTLFLVFYLL